MYYPFFMQRNGMRRFYFSVAYFLLAINLMGQNAKEILSKVNAEMTKNQRVTLGFDLVIKEAERKSFTTKGMAYQKGNLFYIDNKYLSQIYDGKHLYTIGHKNRLIQITNYSEKETDNLLSPFIIAKLYETKKYEYQLVEDQNSNDFSIEFKPIKKNVDFFKIRLKISPKFELKEALLFEKNGTRYTLKIKKMDNSSEIPSSQFTYNKAKYSKYKIEDLRLE